MSEMTKTGLLGLSEQCEAAAEADRRLDYQIMTATVPTGHAYLWDPHDRNHRYTSSCDAALSLLPEGSFWRGGNDGEGPDPSMFFAQVSYERGPVLGFTRATAATAALAIASACLSARHALALSKGSDV